MAYIDQFYTSGTVTVTNGSTTVKGVETGWQTGLVVGGVLYANGGAYPIKSVESETALTLAIAYTGASGSGVAYAIDRQRSAATSNISMSDRLAEIIAGIQKAQPASDLLSNLAALKGTEAQYLRFSGPGVIDIKDGKNLDALASLNGQKGKYIRFADQNALETVDGANLDALTVLKLAAGNLLFVNKDGKLSLSKLTDKGTTLLGSDNPTITDLGFTPINRAGDKQITGDLKTTGKLFVGAALPTSLPETGTPAIQAQAVVGSHSAAMFYFDQPYMYIVGFYKGGYGLAGGIRSDGGNGVQYLTTSDWRAKYDIEPLVTFSFNTEQFECLGSSLLRLMAMRPVSHKWKGGNGEIVHGFLAHELQPITPHAVSGHKDETAIVGVARDKEGNVVAENITEQQCPENATWTKTGVVDVLQKVDHSRLVADLTAAMQELTVLVLEQQKEITTLKGKLKM